MDISMVNVLITSLKGVLVEFWKAKPWRCLNPSNLRSIYHRQEQLFCTNQAVQSCFNTFSTFDCKTWGYKGQFVHVRSPWTLVRPWWTQRTTEWQYGPKAKWLSSLATSWKFILSFTILVFVTVSGLGLANSFKKSGDLRWSL